MLTKEERKTLNQLFWTQFDQFCDNIPELAERKKKWILHDTKIGHLDLKFDLSGNSAVVALEINHKSENRRLQVYEVLEKYRNLLGQGFKEGLSWDYCFVNENKQEICRIYTEKKGLNSYNTSDWISIHQFLSENMLQLQDNFIEIQEALKEELTLLLRES